MLLTIYASLKENDPKSSYIVVRNFVNAKKLTGISAGVHEMLTDLVIYNVK